MREHEARRRLGEAREHHAGDQRQAHQADEDLERRNDMRERGLRVHVAIAHRGQRLDAEEEPAPVTGGIEVGDVVVLE